MTYIKTLSLESYIVEDSTNQTIEDATGIEYRGEDRINYGERVIKEVDEFDVIHDGRSEVELLKLEENYNLLSAQGGNYRSGLVKHTHKELYQLEECCRFGHPNFDKYSREEKEKVIAGNIGLLERFLDECENVFTYSADSGIFPEGAIFQLERVD